DALTRAARAASQAIDSRCNSAAAVPQPRSFACPALRGSAVWAATALRVRRSDRLLARQLLGRCLVKYSPVGGDDAGIGGRAVLECSLLRREVDVHDPESLG